MAKLVNSVPDNFGRSIHSCIYQAPTLRRLPYPAFSGRAHPSTHYRRPSHQHPLKCQRQRSGRVRRSGVSLGVRGRMRRSATWRSSSCRSRYLLCLSPRRMMEKLLRPFASRRSSMAEVGGQELFVFPSSSRFFHHSGPVPARRPRSLSSCH